MLKHGRSVVRGPVHVRRRSRLEPPSGVRRGIRSVNRLSAMMLPVLVVGGIVFVREGGLAALMEPGPVVVAAAEMDPDARLDAAATKLEQATARGGTGFAFAVESRSTLHAREDGPKIEVPDPIDRYKSLGLADEYYVGGSVATGFVEGDGDFFLQMRQGPTTPEAAPDFEKAPATHAALVRDGTAYRNDGDGWYAADQLPGIGLDPATIAKLPTLLRAATGPADTDRALVGNELLPALTATGKVADAPGLMAIDAAPFTELTEPIAFAFDGEGRLAQLTATMRNTKSETFDLIVVTTITFRYDAPAGELPDPEADPAPHAADAASEQD
jgi:hypothetical protein